MLEYWYPQLKKAPEIFNNFDYSLSNYLLAIKYFLQLAAPMSICWLLGFYYIFHVFLNILGEIFYFADWNFYEDWWNCITLQEYWKKWNLPVHQWFIRHLYNPLWYKGVSRDIANTIIFLVSASAHEYWVSVSIGRMGWLVFFSFNMQYFYIIGEKILFKKFNLKNSQFGNFCFWWNFCVFS